ncbi:MAG: cyclic nucleotide-binding domain-containing protein, partial [Thermoleophilia bacterium]|nr:cyclic nucleotide-binding domain-containing protein [Thermoleophilia bacterium]
MRRAATDKVVTERDNPVPSSHSSSAAHPSGADVSPGASKNSRYRQDEVLAVIKRAPLFAGLDDGHLRDLVARGRCKQLDRGQPLFFQGEEAQGLYVVLSGRVKVYKTSPRGREQILMVMGPGEPVGEVAVLSGESYPASAEALEAAQVLYLPRQAFLDLVGREPEVAMRLLAELSA